MGDLFATAQEIQSIVEDAFAVAAIALPARRYVSDGDVAYDCEQLAVEILGLAPGTPAADYAGHPRPGELLVAQAQVALIRSCAPVPEEGGAPPSASSIEANAAKVLADADVLARCFLRTPKVESCQAVKVVQATHYGPEGGVAGWVLTLRVVL